MALTVGIVLLKLLERARGRERERENFKGTAHINLQQVGNSTAPDQLYPHVCAAVTVSLLWRSESG